MSRFYMALERLSLKADCTAARRARLGSPIFCKSANMVYIFIYGIHQLGGNTMRTKLLLIIPISLSLFMLSGTASATFQSINECVIDKFCTNPKNPGCHFKWNKKFLYCMKYYDFHGKSFN